MRLRYISVLMFSLMLSLPVFALRASAQELTKKAKIERIMTLTEADAMADQVLNQMKAAMKDQMFSRAMKDQRFSGVMESMAASRVPPAVITLVRAKVQETLDRIVDRVFDPFKGVVSKVHPQVVKIYDDNYSDEEINGMLAFYESPTGRAVTEKMPLVTSQSMAAAQAEMKNLAPPDIQRIVQDETTNLIPEIQRIIKEAGQR